LCLFFQGSLISLAFLIATSVYYTVNKKLRSNSGLSFLFFIVPLAVACALLVILHRRNLDNEIAVSIVFTLGFCLQSAFTWISIMTFDIMWTFCRFRKPTENLKRFMVYCLSTFVNVGIFASFYVSHDRQRFYLIYVLFLIFCLLAISDVLFIVIAGFRIFLLSRTLTLSEHSRFQEETRR
jgi:hypothetical protein